MSDVLLHACCVDNAGSRRSNFGVVFLFYFAKPFFLSFYDKFLRVFWFWFLTWISVVPFSIIQYFNENSRTTFEWFLLPDDVQVVINAPSFAMFLVKSLMKSCCCSLDIFSAFGYAFISPVEDDPSSISALILPCLLCLITQILLTVDYLLMTYCNMPRVLNYSKQLCQKMFRVVELLMMLSTFVLASCSKASICSTFSNQVQRFPSILSVLNRQILPNLPEGFDSILSKNEGNIHFVYRKLVGQFLKILTLDHRNYKMKRIVLMLKLDLKWHSNKRLTQETKLLFALLFSNSFHAVLSSNLQATSNSSTTRTIGGTLNIVENKLSSTDDYAHLIKIKTNNSNRRPLEEFNKNSQNQNLFEILSKAEKISSYRDGISDSRVQTYLNFYGKYPSDNHWPRPTSFKSRNSLKYQESLVRQSPQYNSRNANLFAKSSSNPEKSNEKDDKNCTNKRKQVSQKNSQDKANKELGVKTNFDSACANCAVEYESQTTADREIDLDALETSSNSNELLVQMQALQNDTNTNSSHSEKITKKRYERNARYEDFSDYYDSFIDYDFDYGNIPDEKPEVKKSSSRMINQVKFSKTLKEKVNDVSIYNRIKSNFVVKRIVGILGTNGYEETSEDFLSVVDGINSETISRVKEELYSGKEYQDNSGSETRSSIKGSGDKMKDLWKIFEDFDPSSMQKINSMIATYFDNSYKSFLEEAYFNESFAENNSSDDYFREDNHESISVDEASRTHVDSDPYVQATKISTTPQPRNARGKKTFVFNKKSEFLNMNSLPKSRNSNWANKDSDASTPEFGESHNSSDSSNNFGSSSSFDSHQSSFPSDDMSKFIFWEVLVLPAPTMDEMIIKSQCYLSVNFVPDFGIVLASKAEAFASATLAVMLDIPTIHREWTGYRDTTIEVSSHIVY